MYNWDTMNTDKLNDFFNTKLEKIPELKNLNTYKDPEFNTWWNTVKSTCERMGESYSKRAEHIRFFPGMVVAAQIIVPPMRAHIIVGLVMLRHSSKLLLRSWRLGATEEKRLVSRSLLK